MKAITPAIAERHPICIRRIADDLLMLLRTDTAYLSMDLELDYSTTIKVPSGTEYLSSKNPATSSF